MIEVDHSFKFDPPDVWRFSKAMPWVAYNCRTYWPDVAAYHAGELPPNFPMPAIAQCYCGHSIENHRDRIPCDYLGFFNYG